MQHDIPFGNSNLENGPTFLDFPLFLGIFQWDEPTKRVSFTSEREIPEILTKWKAPIVTRYMYDALRRDFALSASFVLECFDGSEVTTRQGNELVAQKENCIVGEIKEVELRSRRGKFIYNSTYNCIGLNQVSQLYFRQNKLP